MSRKFLESFIFTIFSFCSIFGNFFQSFSIYRNLVEFLNQTYEKRVFRKNNSLRQNYQKLSKTIENIENRGNKNQKHAIRKNRIFFNFKISNKQSIENEINEKFSEFLNIFSNVFSLFRFLTNNLHFHFVF